MSGKDKSDVELGSTPAISSSNESHSRGNSKEKEKGAGLLQMSTARRWKLLFCFVGLQLSYILWGVVQENLMTQKYEKGSFKSSAFCVFGNRFLALFISLGIVLFRKWRNHSTGNEAPYYQYLPSSLSNSLSSWAQYEALKYISFPTQVLSKSCKIIPVMLVGILVNRKSYPFSEYLEAALITAGVTAFHLTEHKAGGGHYAEHQDSMFGIFLLCLYLACDSFTSQWQSKVYKSFGVDQFQMMLGVNIWSMLLTGLTLFQSGEFLSSLAFILADSTAFLHMTILSITSATGQLFIYYTIKEFGPVVFTIIMTTRQIFSLFVSCILYSHPLATLSWLSAVFVFGVVFNRIYRKGTD